MWTGSHIYTQVCIYMYIYGDDDGDDDEDDDGDDDDDDAVNGPKRQFTIFRVRLYGHHRTDTQKKMTRSGGRGA